MVLTGVITGVLLAGAAICVNPLTSRRPARILAVVVFVAGAGLAIRSLLADHWTEMTPRPVLAFLLEQAEPYPDQLRFGGPAAHLQTGPVPNPDYMYSDDRWERLLWHHQYGHAARAWYERVLATPPERLLTLVQHARQMQELTKRAGGTRWVDSWPSSRMEARLRERTEVDDAEFERIMRHAGMTHDRSVNPSTGPTPGLRTATWAISELQFLDTGTPEMRQGFVPPPMDVLEAIADAGLAAGDDEAVRYAIDRAAPLKSAGAQALLERLARELAAPEAPARTPSGIVLFDADTRDTLVQRLDNALQWRASFARPDTWVEVDGVVSGGDADVYELPAVPSP